MAKKPKKIVNCLRLYRKKNALSQKEVASLMGFRTTASISRYEHGSKLPNLINLLKLETIYHTPIAFLFRELCEELRSEIRRKIERRKSKKEEDKPGEIQ